MKYEKAQLIEVGAAEKVVLGISMFGNDPDTRDFPWPFEFADDCDDNGNQTE